MNTLIGNTPFVKINYEYKNKIRSIYTKLEYYNFTGSIKDRMVEYILKKNKENGSIKDDDLLIEATSGNTGISLAAIGAKMGHKVHIFIPDFVSKERIDLLKLYGAEVTLVSKEEGGYETCIKKADELQKEKGGYRLDQFKRLENVTAHYNGTASEIVLKLENINGFVTGIGTGGTLMGCALKFRETNKNIKIAVIEPSTMKVLNEKVIGDHKIEGISDGFIPSIVDTDIIDEVIIIDEEDAINLSRKLSKKLGLGVGISSGANMLGAIHLEEKTNGNVVTIFADDSKKYLSTELSKEIDENKNFISNQIRLISFEVL
jgi:Cysteine synthase